MTDKSFEDANVLHVCPAPLPARVRQRNTFFDSVLVGHEKLQEPTMVCDFLAQMLQWAGRTPNKSQRYLQNVIDAYYLVGLVPRIWLSKDMQSKISSELPSKSDLPSLRRYCLNLMTLRLSGMSTFWQTLGHCEPFTTRELRELLKEGFSLDDIKRRLLLMRNLGALEKKGHKHWLTQLGRAFVVHNNKSQYQLVQDAKVVKESSSSTDYVDSFGSINFLDRPSC